MNEYVSNLAPLIINFLEFKNALGIQYHTGSYYLRQLDIYNCKHKNVFIPDCDTVEGWALHMLRNRLQEIEVGFLQSGSLADTFKV